MAQFDLFHSESGLLLDVQAAALDDLNTRVAVPLLPIERAPKPADRLNPVFMIGDRQYVMATQFMAAIPAQLLRQKAGTLAHERYAIKSAIDLLLDGF